MQTAVAAYYTNKQLLLFAVQYNAWVTAANLHMHDVACTKR